MTIEELRAIIEKLGLKVDESSGQVLIEWEKIPFSEDDRPYWAALSSIEGIGPQVLAVLVSGFGSAEAVFKVSNKKLLSTGVPERVAEAIVHFIKEREIADWFQTVSQGQSASIPAQSFIVPVESSFPERLRQLRRGPSQLWVWGKVKGLLARHPIAMVGTRKMTAYGREVTTRIASQLARRNCVVVSGLMYGVDETAMRAALAAKGVVIGVWAGGLSRRSLGSRWRLASEIVAAGGAIVSEFPPERTPTKGLFPTRNRIVSGLSKAVVVTQGAARSGSLITARFGMEQGRPVFAVPGPVTSSLSDGPNELLKLGALAITRADDVLETIKVTPDETGLGEFFDYEPQNESEAVLISALKERSMTIDQLVRETDMSVGQIGENLVELELKGVVRQMGDEWTLLW